MTDDDKEKLRYQLVRARLALQNIEELLRLEGGEPEIFLHVFQAREQIDDAIKECYVLH